jgi:hypothetical protein
MTEARIALNWLTRNQASSEFCHSAELSRPELFGRRVQVEDSTISMSVIGRLLIFSALLLFFCYYCSLRPARVACNTANFSFQASIRDMSADPLFKALKPNGLGFLVPTGGSL